MKTDALSVLLRAGLVAASVFSGAYAFVKYQFGIQILGEACTLINSLIWQLTARYGYPAPFRLDASTAIAILSIAFLFWGLKSVVIDGGNGEKFLFSIGFWLLAPSIISYSSVRWCIWLNSLLGVPTAIFETDLTYQECLLCTATLTISYLTFNLTSSFKKEKEALMSAQGNPKDIDRIYGRHHIFLLAIIASASLPIIILAPTSIINEKINQVIESVPYGLFATAIILSLIIITTEYFYIKKSLKQPRAREDSRRGKEDREDYDL